MKLLYHHPGTGRLTGLEAVIVHEEPFEAPRVVGFLFTLHLAVVPQDPQAAEIQLLAERDRAVQRARFNDAYYLFLSACRHAQAACSTQQERDAVNALYLRFLTKTAFNLKHADDSDAKAVTELLERLVKLEIYDIATLPQVSDEQLAAEAFAV